jgi:hypothetical protein
VSHDHRARENGPLHGTIVLCVVDVLLVCVARQPLVGSDRAWTACKALIRRGMHECRDWKPGEGPEAKQRLPALAEELLEEAA